MLHKLLLIVFRFILFLVVVLVVFRYLAFFPITVTDPLSIPNCVVIALLGTVAYTLRETRRKVD